YEIAHINSAPFWRATMQAQSSGTFMEMLRVNIWEGQLASLAWAWENGRVFQTAGLFILGMLIGRNGWFRREYLDRWSRVLALSLVCFFPLYGLNGMLRDYISNPNILEPLGILVSSLMKLCFMFMLVSGILFGYYRAGRLSRILGALIPYGKLSMTNYVTQGIIGSFLFYHWGLFLRMGITASVFVGGAIFVVQYMLCRFWVGRHKHGPLEYLWKKATWI
ncbi:MAG: DUF418 domain-containing protein, partial [Muribaculaceae bacterium]|nr:DUF418 domain-containing protein [Muribaculaceae bacterium]